MQNAVTEQHTEQPGAPAANPAPDHTEAARRLLRTLMGRFDSLPERDRHFLEGWRKVLSGEGAPVGICQFAQLSKLAARLGLIAPELAEERAEECRAVVDRGMCA